MFNEIASSYAPEVFAESLYTDGGLSRSELNLDTALALRDYGIWGTQYPAPVFDNVFTVVSKRVLKQKHLKLDLLLDQCVPVSAMWFFVSEDLLHSIHCQQDYRLFYSLDVNTYLGESRLSLIISHHAFVTAPTPA